MLDVDFGWDDAKAARNWRNHHVSLEMARDVFRDVFAIEWADAGQDTTEQRLVVIEMVEGRLPFIAHTMRGDWARRVGEETGYASPQRVWRTRRSGGGITMTTRDDWTGADKMTDADILRAAIADPDTQPIGPDRLARMRPTPRLKIIRRALGHTQEEFAARFQIPLGALRPREQGTAEPDQTARACLKTIAGDPVAVERALEAGETRSR